MLYQFDGWPICHEGMLGCSPKGGGATTWGNKPKLAGYLHGTRPFQRVFSLTARRYPFLWRRIGVDFSESITTNHDATVLTVNFHFWLPIQRVLDLYNLQSIHWTCCLANTSNGSQHAATNKGSCCHKGRQFSRATLWSSEFPVSLKGLGVCRF